MNKTTQTKVSKSPKGTKTTGKRPSRGPSKTDLRKQEVAQRRLKKAIEEAPKAYALEMALAFRDLFEDAIRAAMLIRAHEAGNPTDANWFIAAGGVSGAAEFRDAGRILARVFLETKSASMVVSSHALDALDAQLDYIAEVDAAQKEAA